MKINISTRENNYFFSWKEFANDDFREIQSRLSPDFSAIDYTLINTQYSESSCY